MAHILIVDDRQPNRQLLATVLGYYGHSVAEAADGVIALDEVTRRMPDLLITDLLMPNMDGETLCRQLREARVTASLPIIIHTASYRARQASKIAQSLGVKWVLAKPSGPQEIISMVTEALGLPVAAMPEPFAQARLPRPAAPLVPEGIAQDAPALAQQLTSLVNLGLQMSWERDTDALAELFCGATRDILSARYVGVVIVTAQGSVGSFKSRGLDRITHDAVASGMAACPAALKVLDGAREGRMLVAAKTGDFTGLPPAHPVVRSLLAAPLMTRDADIGWFYAADRLGEEGFGADDERLVLGLGAVFATAWTSLLTLDELDKRVAHRTRELEAANAQLEAFSALVSHDLRAPLGSIGGYADALIRKFGAALPPDGLRYLDKIGRNVTSMTRLIEGLLHFAKTSRTDLVVRQCELSELVGECLSGFKNEIERRSVTVNVGPLPGCRMDRSLIAQVLVNLIGNALKYTRHQPTPTLEIQARREGSEIEVLVRDNGAGFDMNFVDKLFSPFSRLHSVAEFEGSGIGLALVKNVVSRHGGRVWAESSPGKGACFYFTLPV